MYPTAGQNIELLCYEHAIFTTVLYTVEISGVATSKIVAVFDPNPDCLPFMVR